MLRLTFHMCVEARVSVFAGGIFNELNCWLLISISVSFTFSYSLLLVAAVYSSDSNFIYHENQIRICALCAVRTQSVSLSQQLCKSLSIHEYLHSKFYKQTFFGRYFSLKCKRFCVWLHLCVRPFETVCYSNDCLIICVAYFLTFFFWLNEIMLVSHKDNMLIDERSLS